ncbi:MAG TPA: hypothetical protein VFG69_11545 [Nannocystaceae bacterium]|nr:hypothetical protein [Nannocystaceae bacterium]
MRTALTLVSVLGLVALSCDDSDDESCPEETRTGALVAEPEPAAHEAGEEEGEECGEEGEFGPPTESVCPEGSTLTWESFGRQFMATYCTECHSSQLMGADRQGAPLFHDFDTLEGVLPVLDHIDYKAAAGPAATNELMPPAGNPQPTDEERHQLGEWLACEVAKM